MFAHVLALCFILQLLKRSDHYAPILMSCLIALRASGVKATSAEA